MKKIVCVTLLAGVFFTPGCKKDSDNQNTTPVAVTEQDVLNDFAGVLANPNYMDLQASAAALNTAVLTLNSSATDSNLTLAKNAWRAIRVPWEQAEGFLFGPAEDFNYDPATDTWPVNITEMDSLLASNNPLLLSNVDSLQYSLKGYHPIEYLLFGTGGNKTASQLTARELLYMVSLTQSVYNITSSLRDSWNPASGNFSAQLTTAGDGSTRFSSKKNAFLAIVNAMQNICNEVANNKMQVPLSALDPELVESQFAQNASLDFKNNIVGVQNVYMCRYSTSSGKSLHDLISAKNASLDITIQSQISTSINALATINSDYGWAIFNQQTQILNAQTAINNLKSTLGILGNFIQTNITD